MKERLQLHVFELSTGSIKQNPFALQENAVGSGPTAVFTLQP